MAPRSKGLIVVTVLIAGGLALQITAGASANARSQVPQPARIISLIPAATEMLFAIGAGPQVVAGSSYDTYPPEVTRLPKVGALLNPDSERIFELKPTLVITYASQADLETRLARAGIRHYSFRHQGVEGILRTLYDLGDLTGHAAGAESAVRRFEDQIDRVRQRVGGRPRPRTLMVFGREPQTLRQVYATGGLGFLNEILEIAGATNVFADTPRESVQPSTETLIVRKPEAILEVRSGQAPPADVIARERAVWTPLASIPAVRDKRVHFLYGDYLMVPGPRLGQAAEALARVLHPEAYAGAR